MPPGFTCLPGSYQIGTADRRLFWTNIGGTEDFRQRVWTRPGVRSTWRVCQGPECNGKTEHVLITPESNECATITTHDDAAEGARFYENSCHTTNGYQRFYIYRDVPGTNQIGLQLKANGHVVGQERVVDNTTMRQYSSGNQDGTGTYVLEEVCRCGGLDVTGAGAPCGRTAQQLRASSRTSTEPLPGGPGRGARDVGVSGATACLGWVG